MQNHLTGRRLTDTFVNSSIIWLTWSMIKEPKLRPLCCSSCSSQRHFPPHCQRVNISSDNCIHFLQVLFFFLKGRGILTPAMISYPLATKSQFVEAKPILMLHELPDLFTFIQWHFWVTPVLKTMASCPVNSVSVSCTWYWSTG